MLTLLFLLLPVVSPGSSCDLEEDLSYPIAALLCQVEAQDPLLYSLDSVDDQALCLLGQGKCDQPLPVPAAEDLTPVTELPVAVNPMYQRLSLTAERLLPTTWWRQAFNDSSLLLTPRIFPLRLFQLSKDVKKKRLRNIANCLARISIIRTDFADTPAVPGQREECRAKGTRVVQLFEEQWTKDGGRFGGSLSEEGKWSAGLSNRHLYKLASGCLDYFIETAGDVWTGCIRLSKSSYCRGALSAAVLLEGIRIIAELSTHVLAETSRGTMITEGFLLASIGRHLLHGSRENPFTQITPWKVRLVDFVALQSMFFRIYMNSFGQKYTQQLNTYVPLAFPPDLDVSSDLPWKNLASQVEPVYSTLRNWMFTEANNPIDFGPYHPLVAIRAAREALRRSKGKRILIDVGASGFFASPKYILDSYAIYTPFTDVIMIEPVPRFKASVPPSYFTSYNITILPIYVEVATGTDNDIMKLIPSLVQEADFVVLKFDVDPNRFAVGPTMEWGFLFDLIATPAVLKLIDELYVELHFHFPMMKWNHYHSNWEALDLLRYLRNQGVVIHPWP